MGGLSVGPWVDVGPTESGAVLSGVDGVDVVVLSTAGTVLDDTTGSGAPMNRALHTWPAVTLGRRRSLR